jgi:hypothetical protein
MSGFLRWLQWIALSLWLGGLIGIGALGAPAAFEVIRHAHATAGLTPPEQSALAGLIVGTALRHFNTLCIVLSALLFVGTLAVFPAVAKVGGTAVRRLLGEGFVVLILVGTLVLSMDVLLPAMDAAQAAGHMTHFDSLHHFYEQVANVQMVLLLTLAGLFVARDRIAATSANTNSRF